MITRAQMPRQLRDKGGIASVTPRENYGLGSKIKERFRKLIPNELADVAVKAAPFVAPFNPGIAGLMRGIGRFDQRGSISDALKQGAATFGFGKAAGFLGGAQSDPGILGRQRFSMEGFKEGPVGRLFKGDIPGGDTNTPKFPGKEKTGPLKNVAEKVFENVPFSDKLSTKVKEKLLVGGLTSGASALYSYFTGEFEPQQPGETVGEYLARRNERVKLQMRQVMDSYYTPLRNPEYAAMTPEQKDNFIDGLVGQAGLEGTTDYQGEARATGGRVGYQTGGITMANTLAENIRRNIANQASVGQMFQAARDKIAKAKDYAVPVVQGARALLTGAGEPIITNTMRQDLIKRAEAKGGDSGSLGYEDYGLQTSTPGGRFAGGITDIISDPQAFANAATLGRVSFDRDPETGEYSFGDTKYDFTPDPDTGSTGSALLDFINEGGVKAKISDLLTPSTAAAAEPGTATPTPDAGSRMVDGVSQEGVIPGFKKVRSEFYNADGTPNQEKIKAANFIPGSSPSEFYYERIGEEGGFGPETYSRIAAGQYPDIYDPNKTLPVEPPKKIIPEEGTIGPITKLPIAPDPDTPIDELIKPIMPTLPVEPQTDQDLIEGFAKFKEQNPDAMSGAGTMAIVEGTLPDGTPIKFSGSVESNAFNKYLESLGLSRADIVKPRENIESLLKSAKLAKGGMPTGIMKTNKAGVMERDYRDKGGFVPVGIKEKADDVPAMLSKNEFVFTADAVRGAGNGSIEKGAQRMYDTMKNLEKRVT